MYYLYQDTNVQLQHCFRLYRYILVPTVSAKKYLGVLCFCLVLVIAILPATVHGFNTHKTCTCIHRIRTGPTFLDLAK